MKALWSKQSPREEDVSFDYNLLTTGGNLTQKLRETYGAISLSLVSEGMVPSNSIYDCSIVLDNLNYVRKIYLSHQEVPLTYGKVIFDTNAYQYYQKQLSSLGTRPIGETLLYKNKGVSRSSFSYALLTPEHYLHQEVGRGICSPLDAPIWSRFSTFMLPTGTLQLIEAFLPALSRGLNDL